MRVFLAWIMTLLMCGPVLADSMNGGGGGTTIPGGLPVGVPSGGTGATTLTGVLNGNGTSPVTGLTNTQLTTHINAFTSGLSGAVPASGGGSTNFLRADGTFAAPAGGGSSPFVPAGVTRISALDGFNYLGLATSPDGAYVYAGGTLANTHAAILQIKTSDGTVKATCDLGIAGETTNISVSPDGSFLSATDGQTKWFKVATAAMTLVHTSTLAASLITNTNYPFDLSPDGTIFAYVDGATDVVHKLNTSTYAETTVTVGHSDGGSVGAGAICWYNGSSANFYVAYKGVAAVDLYSAGVYTSTVATGASGTPWFWAMRSGINGSFWIADIGSVKSIIEVDAGTPTIYPTSGNVQFLDTNRLSPLAITTTFDACVFYASGSTTYFWVVGPSVSFGAPIPLSIPATVFSDGAVGLALAPDDSMNLYYFAGTNECDLWSQACILSNPQPGPAGNIQTSDGDGQWLSRGGFNTNGNGILNTAGNGFSIKTGSNAKAGTATLVAGTVTVSDTSVTANSQVYVTNAKGSSNTGLPVVSAVTTSTGFTITSTNAADASTVSYLIMEQP